MNNINVLVKIKGNYETFINFPYIHEVVIIVYSKFFLFNPILKRFLNIWKSFETNCKFCIGESIIIYDIIIFIYSTKKIQFLKYKKYFKEFI